jgi:hypothetical protein
MVFIIHARIIDGEKRFPFFEIPCSSLPSTAPECFSYRHLQRGLTAADDQVKNL